MKKLVSLRDNAYDANEDYIIAYDYPQVRPRHFKISKRKLFQEFYAVYED